MENNNIVRQCGRWLFSLGFGGISTCYFINIIVNNLFPILDNIGKSSVNIQKNMVFESLIMLVSLILIIIAPFFMRWTNNSTTKILILIFLIFANISGIVTVIVRNEIFITYIAVVWLTFSFLIRQIIELGEYLFRWLTDQNTGNQQNMVKLTFLWTIIAFILGKVW